MLILNLGYSRVLLPPLPYVAHYDQAVVFVWTFSTVVQCHTIVDTIQIFNFLYCYLGKGKRQHCVNVRKQRIDHGNAMNCTVKKRPLLNAAGISNEKTAEAYKETVWCAARTHRYAEI